MVETDKKPKPAGSTCTLPNPIKWLSSNDASKQPEEKGQFVAATGVSNPVKQTNDDVVSLDNEHQQNGNQQYNHCQNQDWVNDPKGSYQRDFSCMHQATVWFLWYYQVSESVV
jgi:hypothetical protein